MRKNQCQQTEELEEKKQGFLISVIHPTTKLPHIFKYFDEKQKSDLIMNVMNGLCFSEKVSEKCDVEDRFHYYVQKLDGIEIESPQEPMKGKIWVPYINEKRQDWDALVESNTRVSINDFIVWKMEQVKQGVPHKK